MKHLFSILMLVAVLVTACPLFAQAQLSGNLVIDSIEGYKVEMTLTVTNTGDQTFSHYFNNSEMSFFSIDGVEQHEASLPVALPLTLLAGASETFQLTNFDVLSSGGHVIQAYLAIYDNLANPLAMGVPQTVLIAPAVAVNIGAGDQHFRVPIDFFYRSSLYQCVYTAAELNHTAGYINAISFYPDFTNEAMLQQPLEIYLGNTFVGNLAAGWLDFNVLGINYAGFVDFPIGQNEVVIPLQYGIYYNGTDNLAMMVFREMTASYQMTSDPFHAFAADPLRSRKACSDTENLRPFHPPTANASQHIAFMPQTTFHIIPFEPSAASDEHLLPAPLALSHYPNPVRGNCTFKLKTEKQSPAQIEIFNLKGQKIRTLSSANAGGKEHLFTWDTRDAKGVSCAAGVYLYRCQAGKSSSIQRLVLIR